MWKIAGLGFAILIFGCGDNTNNTPDMTAVPIPHNFDQINQEIFSVSCANFSVCHMTKMQSSNNLDLKTDPYAALVGVTSVNDKAKAQGLLRVKPCDSANSFLITKFLVNPDQDPKTGYGTHMPQASEYLPMEQIQAIKDWIDRGALKNEPATVTGNTCMVRDMSMTGGTD